MWAASAVLGVNPGVHEEQLHPMVGVASDNMAVGRIPLCLVQHDDRTETELHTERSLVDLNQYACARDEQCRYIFTRKHFDENVEPHWQKLLAVRSALERGCRHAVWLDSDVVVHTTQPSRLLTSFEGRPVFINADP